MFRFIFFSVQKDEGLGARVFRQHQLFFYRTKWSKKTKMEKKAKNNVFLLAGIRT